jgi:hypothetical protein
LGTDDLLKKRREEKNRKIKTFPDFVFCCEGTKTEGNYIEGLIEDLCNNYGVAYSSVKSKFEIIGLGRNTISVTKKAKDQKKLFEDFKKHVDKHTKQMRQPTICVIFDKDSFSDNAYNAAAKMAEDNSTAI